MNETDKIRLELAVSENDSHAQVIEGNLTRLRALLPIDADGLADLTVAEIMVLDQTLYRLIKMQDSLGLRLIPTLYRVIEPQAGDIPFIDMLRRLEKLGILTSEEDWQRFRRYRNSVTHNYPGSQKQAAIALNELLGELPMFLALYRQLRGEVLRRLGEDLA